MKILFICNYFQPLHYGENEVSRELSLLGHDITILTGDKYFPFPNYKETAAPILGSRQLTAGVFYQDNIRVIRKKVKFEFAARAFFGGIINYLQTHKPDIILVYGAATPAAVQAALGKPFSSKLILIDSHLPSELKRGNKIFKLLFYGFFRFLCVPILNNKADKIVAVQEATVDVIKNIYGITVPVTVISHGTNQRLFTFRKRDRLKIRKKLGITQSGFIIVYTGKIIEAKGVKLLFQALEPLFMKRDDVHLVIAGAGPNKYLAECWRSVSEKFHSRIHLLGLLDHSELPALYSAADVAVWPLQESLSMIDAASCSLPFIANDQVGVKERVSNKNALLYKHGDVNDLSQKIAFLYSHPKVRREMGRRGRDLVERKMSWQQKTQEYIQ